jgi:hypothetical protein
MDVPHLLSRPASPTELLELLNQATARRWCCDPGSLKTIVTGNVRGFRDEALSHHNLIVLSAYKAKGSGSVSKRFASVLATIYICAASRAGKTYTPQQSAPTAVKFFSCCGKEYSPIP